MSFNAKKIGLALACMTAALFALLWPGLYNGQPFLFQDTSAYIRGFDAAAQKLSGHKSQWSEAVTTPECSGSGAGARMSSVAQKIVLSGRSVYYGALLYLGDLAGGEWLSVVLQALAVMLAIGLTLSDCRVFRWQSWAAICLGLAVFTPLAFFVSFLMPDLFAGIAILAMANIIVFARTMPGWRLAVWTSLLGASVLFHSSNLLIAVIVGMLGLGFCLVRRGAVAPRAVIAAALAILVGFAGEAAFNRAVHKMLGADPIRPPFITARLLADGPGAAYLQAKCPQAGFEACKFTGLLPVKSSDDFLWSENPRLGAFAVADATTKRALGDEQYRFGLAVLGYAPFSLAAASSGNTARQLVTAGLEEFNGDPKNPGAVNYFQCHLPPPVFAVLENTKFWHADMPVTLFTWLDIFAALVSLGYIVVRVVAHMRSSEAAWLPRERLVALLLVGLLANAFVCGAMSGLHSRYQARVLWLLPFAALLLVSDAASERRRSSRNS